MTTPFDVMISLPKEGDFRLVHDKQEFAPAQEGKKLFFSECTGPTLARTFCLVRAPTSFARSPF